MMDDPAGIGPEIIIKSLSEAGPTGAPVVVVGYVRTSRRIMVMSIMPQAELRVIQKVCGAHFAPGAINATDEPLANPGALTPGVVQAAAGDLVHRCIKRATALALSDEMKAIVTASPNKEALHFSGHNYPGHTELLARLTGNKEYAMVFYTDKFKVIHISTHISLHKFLDTLNDERVKAVIRATSHFLKRIGIKRPRTAVADVNPHAGKHGLFGTEEIEIIAPAIEVMQAEGIDVTGPCPSDTVFMQCHEGLFDMIAATYHDQGYIPLKLLGFYDGVNITAGLPFTCTFADRGTVLDIAWTGKTRFESMAVSIQSAMQTSRERDEGIQPVRADHGLPKKP